MTRISSTLLSAVAICSLLSICSVRAQEEGVLDAKRRIFSDVGAGCLAIRRGPGGSYYVLVSDQPAAFVFAPEGGTVRRIPPEADQKYVVSLSALDVDAAGRVYVADDGGSTVRIYGPDGSRIAEFTIPWPEQIVALPQDRFAVQSAGADHLIAVYDLHGKLLHEIGDLEDLSDDRELNHRLNAGHLASDKAGNLYFAFRYLPEPTVRKYDSNSGLLLDEISLTTPDFQPMAQSARQEIARASSGKIISPHDIISALGLDPETQELWLALGNLLLHFNSADQNTSTSRAYTTSGARLVPNFILPEKNRLILGSRTLGIYEFPRENGAAPRSQRE